ncbi:MAE_28990/MAE_18760 family HEPN-like nuclease [Citrobacter enshiensis]|uniref:MAE_28990/MAE_18760 family HEPN-like nuclease n=1 Tax=Citrobacter enshiensis TaxID=2971264 RepID=UPI0023E88BD0|nr:MAE_28990/MAE_18760 family HEPN-like nuclease [Citrobacter enshiensis]WET40733.1 MAE_28990/MAE_18760 family HEPN-like nuclease [Citrobacter enshiensis]
MNIRSIYELESYLDNDLAWRKKEFTTLKFMIKDARNHEAKILKKTAITLLYSHWEGYLKNSSQAYLCYLNHLSPKYCDLRENFVQLSLAEKFSSGFSLKKYNSQRDIYKYITGSLQECLNIDEKRVVDTESNLKYQVLCNLMGQIGLDIRLFELKENFIDTIMLKYRNAIAHGDRVQDDEVDLAYDQLETELLDMIMTYQNLIKNAAVTKSFLKVDNSS